MACSGAFATAFDFGIFWCLASLVVGTDDSGGASNLSMTDSTANFSTGISESRVTVGMPIYNATKKTYGKVTLVAATVLTTTTLWDNGDVYQVLLLGANQVATIERFLDIAASDIHSALAASGACDCTLASWATEYLKKLNVIDAAIYHNCPCGSAKLTDTQRQSFLRWISAELKALRTGNLEVCQGATGADFPAVGWAEQSLTDRNASQIIYNAFLREL